MMVSVLTQIFNRFLAYFQNPSLAGIGIALLMALVWVLLFGLHTAREWRIWLMLAGTLLSGLLTVSLVLTPLNILLDAALDRFQSGDKPGNILLTGLLSLLVTGLVQEGAKLLPLLILQISSRKKLNAHSGLLLGAAAGIGFSFLEAQWVTNALFAAGWKLSMLVRSEGLPMLLALWERLVMIGMHACLSALAGWGLGRRRGYWCYLIAALLHALGGLCLLLLANGTFSMVLAEVLLTVLVMVLAVVMLSLRWEKD